MVLDESMIDMIGRHRNPAETFQFPALVDDPWRYLVAGPHSVLLHPALPVWKGLISRN